MTKERLSQVQKEILLFAYSDPEREFNDWGWRCHSNIKDKKYAVTQSGLLKGIYNFNIGNRNTRKMTQGGVMYHEYSYGLIIGSTSGEGNERELKLKEFNKARVVLTRAIRSLIKKELCFAVGRYGEVFAIKPEEHITNIKEQIKKFKTDGKFVIKVMKYRDRMRMVGRAFVSARKRKPFVPITKTQILKEWKEEIENLKKYDSAFGIMSIKGIILTDKGIEKAKCLTPES